MRIILSIVCSLFMGITILYSCSQNNKSKKSEAKQPATEPVTTAPTYEPPIIKIEVVGVSGNFLYVELNKKYTWVFNVTTLNGKGNPVISRIDVPNAPSTMQINNSQNSVIFTPKTNNDLNGIINVYAKDLNCPATVSNCEKMETFYWTKQDSTSQNTTGSNTSYNAMLQILLPIVQKYLEQNANQGSQVADLLNKLLELFKTQQQGLNGINLHGNNFINSNFNSTSNDMEKNN